MTDVAADWLAAHVRTWASGLSCERPFRILSLGCGDGEIDVRVISAARSAAAVDYVGCDINSESLRVFTERVTSASIDRGVRLICSTTAALPDVGRFDLVLLSHVLYYFDDPTTIILEALQRLCAPDGRVVVVHSGHAGVPSMTEQALAESPFVPAETIVTGLREQGVSPHIHRLHTELRVSDDLLASDRARDLFGFLVERQDLGDSEFSRLVDSMKNNSVRSADSWMMPEEVLILEIRTRLPRSRRVGTVHTDDPVRDYDVLAESFDWGQLLVHAASRPDRRHPSRLLDVGCGTGRWLKVLCSVNPELSAAHGGRLVYDRVDPSSVALEVNTAIASTMFRMGRTWPDLIENADLPELEYDLVWAVHSLYTQTSDGLALVIDKLLRSLAPDGTLIIALASAGSFYIEAKRRLLGTDPFMSSDDVMKVLDQRGLAYQCHHVDYQETFDLEDEIGIRQFVWHESIGNSYLPAGLGGELPAMPADPWFESFRGEATFEFAQRTGVITVGN